MIDYWKNQYISRGYYPGGMFTYNDICYVPIPKNSSTYIGSILQNNNWEIFNFTETDILNKTFIILLRDPVDRWVSAISQYFSSYISDKTTPYGVEESACIINAWNEILERVIFDKIIIILSGVFHWINVFSSNHPDILIKKYLKSKDIKIDINFDCELNESKNHKIKGKLIMFLNNLLIQKPYLLDRIKEVYKEDYSLIKQVKFYK